MSTWGDDAFDEHPVWAQVDTLARLLEDENMPKKMTMERHRAVARIKCALELLREHQQKALKVFYSSLMLDTVNNHLSNSVNPALSTFVGDPDSYGNHVIDAAANVEAIFTYVAQWPALPAGGQASAAGRAFSEYKKEAEAALESLQEQNKELEGELVQLRSQMTTIETQMTTVEQRYGTSLEARDEEYTDAIGRIEESGAAAYDKAIAEDIAERVKVLDGYNTTAGSLLEATKMKRDEAAKLAESTREAADWLAQRAVATDFGMQARRKSVAAWVYDALGAAVIGTPLFFVLKHFLDTQGSDGTVALSLTRLSIIFGAVILGGYLFSRGATNHRQARASKSADIRLRTVEAFISQLEPEQQDRIRNGMAENIYLRGRLADDEADSPNPFARLIDRVADGEKTEKDAEPTT
ncbi:hypothetical protein HBE99_20395 [Mycobacteroides chelonae]|uniref:hypothetical protein n=1 Tax=Mycobacteroides chelonae TaxID=1774 RepID=UPI00190FCEB2|nr:hypothetical protein [Mycobacteroides chelonae]QQG98911.1 hypothetical protein HBE99_20395 [Mycobacteroides chelonae]